MQREREGGGVHVRAPEHGREPDGPADVVGEEGDEYRHEGSDQGVSHLARLEEPSDDAAEPERVADRAEDVEIYEGDVCEQVCVDEGEHEAHEESPEEPRAETRHGD